MPPLLSFNRTFPAILAIGDVDVPIKVARLEKTALEELDEAWTRLIVAPRGTTPQPPETATPEEKRAHLDAERQRIDDWNKTVAAERYELFVAIITQHVTLEPGLIEDDGVAVTTGEGLLKIFHARKDVLRDLIYTVITKNHLTEVMAKNSNSPRGSVGGSEPSIPTRGGDAPGPTAASAARSSSAPAAAATASSAPAEAGGPSAEGSKVH